jgi:hypothetical protein
MEAGATGHFVRLCIENMIILKTSLFLPLEGATNA